MPKNNLSQVGKIIYGDSPEGKPWIQARYDELDEGCLKSVVQALHGHAGQYKEARECVRYIWNNRRRMRYPKFHKQGFCTSTGVVEAGCKVVIGTRLKRAGMHWTVKGANKIIALRCSKLSGRFEDSGNAVQIKGRRPHDLSPNSDVRPHYDSRIRTIETHPVSPGTGYES